MSETPLPEPVEKHQLDLIKAQARRMDAQVGEIDRLWKAVQTLHNEKLKAERRVDEQRWKYAQLKLEAWIGLWKLVTVTGAVVVVAWLLAALVLFKHKEIAELLKAIRQGEPSASAPAAQAPSGPTTAASNPAPAGASEAAAKPK